MTERHIEGVAAPLYPHQTEPTENYHPDPFGPDFIDVVPPVVLAPIETFESPTRSRNESASASLDMTGGKPKVETSDNYSPGRVIGGVAIVFAVIAGIATPAVISGYQEKGAAEKLPALAQADGFAGAERAGDVGSPNGDFSFVPTINIKVNDSCTLNSVRFVALDASGNVSWGGNIVDLDSYTLVSYPGEGTSKLVEAFHNMQDFTAQGLAKKYCA